MCELASNKQIFKLVSYNSISNLYDALVGIINEHEISSDDDSAKNELNSVFKEVQKLLKDVYYPSFVKSEYVI